MGYPNDLSDTSIDMITLFFLRQRLSLALAFVFGTIVFTFSLQGNKPIEIDLVVELVNEQSGVAQLYCAADGEKYTSKKKLQFSYSEKYRIAENIYRFTGVLPCDSNVKKLRFDPVWERGHVIVKKFSIKKYGWTDINLNDEFNYSMKILNGVDKFYIDENGIHIISRTHDPFIELTQDLQHHTKLHYFFVAKFILFYTFLSFLAINIVTRSFSLIMTNGIKIEYARVTFSNYLDRLLVSSFSGLMRWSITKRQVNIYVITLAFVISTYANIIHIENIYHAFSYASILAFISSEFHLLALPLLCYFFLESILRRNRAINSIVSGMLIVASVVYLADAYLLRLNGMHVAHGITMLFDGGPQNLLKNIRFTKLSATTLIIYHVATVVIIIGSVFVAKILNRFSLRINFRLSLIQFSVFFVAAIFIIFLEQTMFSHLKGARKLAEEQANMPLYIMFNKAKDHLLVYNISVAQFKQHDKDVSKVQPKNNLKNGNNFYLFILESVREDVINTEVTPNIDKFRQDAISFTRAIANGNATHYGWYAIINSRTPLFWETYRNLNITRGSSGLLALKQAGYQINIHSAKDLSYLQSDKVMFGNKEPVYDYLSDHPDLSPLDHDIRVINHLIAMSLEQAKGGNSFNAIFLDSTHYPYRWKAGSIEEFKPYIGTPQGSVSLNTARNLAMSDSPQITNRYKNSIKYTDMLFGKFIDSLKKNKLYEKSVIVVVGDHGQQFMEHNFLMHGKTLYSEDLHIPLYIRIPGQKAEVRNTVGNQIDIMPTLLDYAGLEPAKNNLSDGRSLLADTSQGFGVSFAAGMQNTPHSFILETNNWKIMSELEIRAPKESRRLFIKKILNSDDEEYIPGAGTKMDYKSFIDKHFSSHFKNSTFLEKFEYNPQQ